METNMLITSKDILAIYVALFTLLLRKAFDRKKK